MATHKISELALSLLSPEMVKNMARVRIITSELYDADGYPVEGGVMDPRLGVIDPGLQCRTCGGGIGDCLGHFGYLELAKPVIHVLYTKTTHNILKLTCRKCSRIMIKEGIETEGLEGITTKQPSKCPHCKAAQKKIIFSKPYAFYEDKDELTPVDIRERFEKIPNRDLKLINFNGGRPEWLIITLFPIPPVTMRPSITLEGGERSEDDLTHKLVDIVRINQSLKENIDIGAPDFIILDLWELVQYHLSTYFDNELTGAPTARHRSGRALKGIIQRLRAKEGRIRGNLLGKRVNFCARTVVSPDPKISINEVGVPEVMVKELTIPEYVTSMNIKYIKEMFRQNKINYVVRPDGRRIKVTEDNKKDLMENIGTDWIVDRQIMDGDIALFNRQPSLHRVSIMAHYIKILPYQTFRLNPSVCPPYNADFDGDEMNLHILQGEEARGEAIHLMDVKNNIISPRFGGPIIGCDLDQISGVYLLTKDGVELTRQEASQILANANIDAELPNKEKITGKELFSLILPKNITVEYTSSKGKVVIENGHVKSGVIDAKGVGAFKGEIIAKIEKLCDKETLKQFIDNCGRLGIAYLMKRGFSIGLSDLDLPAHTHGKMQEEIDKSIKDANSLIEKYKKGIITILPGMTQKGSLEAQIMNVLANGVSKVSDIVRENIKENDIITMAESGAKGSIINATQMAAVVGQETILGKRIKRGYLGRTLSHFRPNDLSPHSKGFVSRGFKQGLTPFELFWNIMNGREGLMDKSLRTRKSGYMQRRLVNALQDLRVSEDGTVRDAHGYIIQFAAGEDYIDPSKSNWGKFNWMELLEQTEALKELKRPEPIAG